MSTEISFQLFGDGGFINPTPWSHTPDQSRFLVPFYDQASGTFLQKQSRDFDGGWRWFDEYEGCALTIYNRALHPQAYFNLTHADIVDTRLQPETLLLWAKCMVLVEHQYYVSKYWLEDHIRALARRASLDITKEIRGGNYRSHLHPVRQ